MLEARQISGDYSYEERTVIRQRKIKTKKTSMLQVKLVVVGCVFLAIITGLMLTATHSQITHKTDKIIQVKKEISDLQNANERLKLEIDRLKSLDRIEVIAMTKLGMIRPGINDIQYIAFNDEAQRSTTAEAVEGENKVAVEVTSDEIVHPVILAVNKIVVDFIFDMQRSSADM